MQRDFPDSEAGTSRGHFATSSAQAQPVRQSSEPLSPATTSDLVSTKKLGLMHRLLAKAKAHKGDLHKSSSHNLEPQQDQADLFRKSDTRHVQIAEESKENYPAHPILPHPSAQQQQDRSFMSSSLPTTPAGESAVPSIARRSVVSEDHHLKAFESSAPGHLALSIAPQLSEVKGLELLDALEEGALMRLRREHMGRSSTGMGKNAHVRCVAEGFQARLLFDGQGLTSLLKQAHLTDRNQGVHKAVIEYVEVMEGAWHRRKSIEVHTNLGLLSLLPADAVTYATWIIGLNTALTAVELHRGDGIHPLRPARKLPLSLKLKIFDPSMALVQEEPDV